MASRPLRPGDPRRLGDYRLLARLGEGGMGTVFLGRDPAGQYVAVKAIRPEYADQEEFRARFRSEVNRVRQVPSFCTAAVLDADPDHETPYLVVEYVDGPSLREVVTERGPMSAGDLHSVALGVAAALTAIHGAGVIHRDLKPTNVLLSLGLPKVIDFGIARALEVTSQHTRTDQMVGTVGYMAPERLDSTLGPLTPAADIFAWGAVVAYAGTGRIPFGGDAPMATAARILTMPPDLAGLPEPLTGLVSRALTKDLYGRPSANDLVQELLTASSPGPVAPPAGAPRPVIRRFDARELLEQMTTGAPERPFSPAEPPRGYIPRQRGAGGGRAGGGRAGGGRAGGGRAGRRSPANVFGGATIRRLIYALAALLAVAVIGVTVAYARTDDATPASAPPSAPEVTSRAATLNARGPSFFDPLTAPGHFHEMTDDTGSCSFGDDQLRVQANGTATFRCPGPEDTFAGNQTITVDLSLATDDSCGMVWFLYRGDRDYQLTACGDHLKLDHLDVSFLTSVIQVKSSALRAGTRHELSIAIASGHATVAVDKTVVLQAAVAGPGLTSGRVLLGATTAAGSPGPGEVRFADLEVRAG
jgi:tRNA A-37 threonylcarbamoyl transferase component Bud32